MKTVLLCVAGAIIGAVVGFHLPLLYLQVFDPQSLKTVGGLGGLGLLSLLIVSGEAGLVLGAFVGIIPLLRKVKAVPPPKLEDELSRDGANHTEKPLRRNKW